MMPFQQGALDSLCGIYSIINADRIINRTTKEHSQKLFDDIIHFLSRKRLLVDILTEGMFLKHITKILDKVVGVRIPSRELACRNKSTPDLDTFWTSLEMFLDDTPGRAVILGLKGVHDHWTVIERISPKQIDLYDSVSLQRLPRAFCTTMDIKGKRKHLLRPAQTYFLSGA